MASPAAPDVGHFIAIVARHAQLTDEGAERATRVVLSTLAERLSKDERRDLIEQLPVELASWLAHDRGAEAFDADEFLRRIAVREDVTLREAELHARAVFTALSATLTRKELDDLAATLPEDFRPLLFNLDVPDADELARRVASATGLGAGAARRVIDAVLETLAERLPEGEVRDLIARLPVDLHPPLARGIERAAIEPNAKRMRAEEFMQRVAQRAGLAADEARRLVPDVFAVLRRALGPEFHDVAAELPHDYTLLLVQPVRR